MVMDASYWVSDKITHPTTRSFCETKYPRYALRKNEYDTPRIWLDVKKHPSLHKVQARRMNIDFPRSAEFQMAGISIRRNG